MSNGTDIAAEIAAGLIDAAIATGNGKLVATITRAPVDTPTTPWGTAPVQQPTTYDLVCIKGTWTRREIDGTNIRATDLKIMAQAGVVVPTVADKVTLSGEVHNIMSVMPLAVGGVDLYYIIQARK